MAKLKESLCFSTSNAAQSHPFKVVSVGSTASWAADTTTQKQGDLTKLCEAGLVITTLEHIHTPGISKNQIRAEPALHLASTRLNKVLWVGANQQSTFSPSLVSAGTSGKVNLHTQPAVRLNEEAKWDDAANNPLHPFSGCQKCPEGNELPPSTTWHQLRGSGTKWGAYASSCSIRVLWVSPPLLLSCWEAWLIRKLFLYAPTQRQQSGVNWCPTFVRKIISEGSCWTCIPSVYAKTIWFIALLFPGWLSVGPSQKLNLHSHSVLALQLNKDFYLL